MIEIAPDLFILNGFPPYGINIYLMGDVLLDAGTRRARGRILAQLKEKSISAHALTHAHPDHQGASHAVCEKLNIPLWCGEGDADAMESGDWSQVNSEELEHGLAAQVLDRARPSRCEAIEGGR